MWDQHQQVTLSVYVGLVILRVTALNGVLRGFIVRPCFRFAWVSLGACVSHIRVWYTKLQGTSCLLHGGFHCFELSLLT